MKPMLARTVGPKYNRFPCFVQPKLNGIRALFQDGVFQSRDEKLWKTGILDHLTAQLSWCTELILDGELYVHGWRLQRINGAIAVNRKEPIEDTYHVQYHVFDVVDPTKTFSNRFLRIFNAIRDAELPGIRAVHTAQVWLEEEVDLHFLAAVRAGYEGLMLRPDLPYEIDKRSKGLWKKKSWEDGEYECFAVTPGEGKADIGIGAIVCYSKVKPPEAEARQYYKQITRNDYQNEGDFQRAWKSMARTFSVGTGFTDSERIAFMSNPPIGKLVKVRYPYLSADGIPQCPSFLAVLD